jgi:hypothetical protein
MTNEKIIASFSHKGISPNKQPYDTRFIESFLWCSFNAVCSILVMSYHRSQTALRKAAHISGNGKANNKNT